MSLSKQSQQALALVKTQCKPMAALSQQQRSRLLIEVSQQLLADEDSLLAANAEDLKLMDSNNPLYDRLELNESRLNAIAASVAEVANLPGPLGEIMEARTLANGLKLKRRRVPIGVIMVVYEARPNVTVDVFTLCFMTGNPVVLRGSRNAWHSNQALCQSIQTVLARHGLENCMWLAPPDREQLPALLKADQWIEAVIPRGGSGLIRRVREEACIAVIETGAGIVHTYLDWPYDLSIAQQVIQNAKLRRVSVCNALDTLLVHRNWLPQLAELLSPLAAQDTQIYADVEAMAILDGPYTGPLQEANEERFGQEFLSKSMTVAVVDGLDQAMSHIDRYGSRHSEAILSFDSENAERFLNQVDAAVVYHNASTAFTDGGVFELGAEVGISTQKLHARGPMGLAALTSYQWQLVGQGHIRER